VISLSLQAFPAAKKSTQVLGRSAPHGVVSRLNWSTGKGSSGEKRCNMRMLFMAVLFAGAVTAFEAANAAGGCGPGCHASASGACVVDGWGTVRNECPAGNHPHPPCPRDTRFRHGACMPY